MTNDLSWVFFYRMARLKKYILEKFFIGLKHKTIQTLMVSCWKWFSGWEYKTATTKESVGGGGWKVGAVDLQKAPPPVGPRWTPTFRSEGSESHRSQVTAPPPPPSLLVGSRDSPDCRVCFPPDSTPRGRVPVGVRPFSVSTFSLSSLCTATAQTHTPPLGKEWNCTPIAQSIMSFYYLIIIII